MKSYQGKHGSRKQFHRVAWQTFLSLTAGGKSPSRSEDHPSACVTVSASKFSSQNCLVIRKAITLFAFWKPGDAHLTANFQLPTNTAWKSTETFSPSLSLLLSASAVSRQQTRWQMSTGRVETTCMGRKKKPLCRKKVRKIHNNKNACKRKRMRALQIDTE